MESKTDRTPPEQPGPAEQPKAEKKKRFRIEKVEERIAPKKHIVGNSSATDTVISTSASIY